MGDWTRQHEHSWPTLDALTWPVRRWVCDRLVGQHAYTRNTALTPEWTFEDLPITYSSSPPTPTYRTLATRRRRET